MEGGDVGLGGGRWREDDEEFRVGGAKGGLRSKPRFTFTEVKALLQSVMKNRFIILRKFNQGVSSETKKQTWAEITDQINSLGENRREVRQIMKKWADLKCDGKRRIAAMRGPNGCHIRKKTLGPVERMVHKILMMSPQGDGDSDLEFGDDEDFPRNALKPHVATPTYSYLSLTENSYPLQGGVSFDISPLSSPEKDPGSEPYHSSPEFDLADDADYNMDLEDNDDSLFSSSVPPAPSTSLDPLPDGALQRVKPVHTYSRNSQNQNSSSSSSSSKAAPPGPSSSSVASTSSALPAPSDATAPPTSQSPPSSPPLPPPTRDGASSSSSSQQQQRPPPAPSSAPPSDPLPTAAPSQRVAQMAAQSLQQQRASRMLLASVSQSLEVLAQSVQLLVESQQEFVQESLLLQRETVDVLREFSGTALAMLRDKGAGQRAAHHHHPASHF